MPGIKIGIDVDLRRSSSPQPWVPEDNLTSLVQYHDQTFDTDPIGQWDDEVGTNHLTEASAKPDQVAYPGGLVGVNFVRANTDKMDFTSAITEAGDFCIGWCHKLATLDVSNYLLSGASTTFVHLNSDDMRLRLSSTTANLLNGFAVDQYQKCILDRLGTSVKLYVDGVVIDDEVNAGSMAAIARMGRSSAAAYLDGSVYRFIRCSASNRDKIAELTRWLSPMTLGYIGPSTSARIANGLTVNEGQRVASWDGTQLWPDNDPVYDGGSIKKWSGNGTAANYAAYWGGFETMLDRNPDTNLILLMAGYQPGDAEDGNSATAVANIKTVIADAQARMASRWPTRTVQFLLTGLPLFPDTCFASPPSTIPAQTRTDVTQVVADLSDPNVIDVGNIFTDVTSATTDPVASCHQNAALRAIHGAELATYIESL